MSTDEQNYLEFVKALKTCFCLILNTWKVQENFSFSFLVLA